MVINLIPNASIYVSTALNYVNKYTVVYNLEIIEFLFYYKA